MHIRWELFLRRFNYVFKHKSEAKNIVANVLSRRMHLLTVPKSSITSFDSLHALYATNEDFKEIWLKCTHNKSVGDFVIHDGFMFKGTQLCIRKTYLRDYLILELHSGGLGAHTGKGKTKILLKERFYWPHLNRDVVKFVQRCAVCQSAKNGLLRIQGYIPLYLSQDTFGRMLVWTLF